MLRPSQIWLLFLLGLALVLPPMGWLTVKALELDRAELAARQQVELEEKVSRALWRMDVFLSPLLAQEAARPEFLYKPVLATLPAGKGKTGDRTLSPLLAEPPEFVLLNFELAADGTLTSPQSPAGPDAAWARSNGALPATMDAACKRLEELSGNLSHADLLAWLPEQTVPQVAVDLHNDNKFAQNYNNNTIVGNTYESPPQQLQVNPRSGGQAGGTQQSQEESAQAPNAQPQAPNPGEFVAANNTGESQGEQSTKQQLTQNPGVFNSSNFGNSRSQRGRSQDNDLQSRNAAYQGMAQRAAVEQNRFRDLIQAPPAVEGVSQPLWLGERLILARRVQSRGTTVIQGCWLDWERLQVRLRDEVADLELPAISFRPVTGGVSLEQTHLLATIPVQLAVAMPVVAPAWDSPIRVSLLVAWICLFLAIFAAAVTLRGVVALSERRGAFVSAVTHELRTPLTTFRMYAEMLAEGMVPSPEARQKYLETLRREADRLAHLVENVLQYARLERDRPGGRRENVTLAALLERTAPRLADRAEQAEMKLDVEAADEIQALSLCTDPAAVEQILFNLVDNACKYASHGEDKRIHLEVSATSRQVQFRVRDHGPGISRQGQRKLFLPFSKSVHEAASTAPGVGLGLALSRRLARDLGGSLSMENQAGDTGAVFVLALPAASAK
ncbi:MAG: sensor histidine kinase [Pirellulaceae bacterium]